MSDKFVDFFLNSKSSVVQFETIELSHPNFSQTYRIVRNHAKGLIATLEDGSPASFEYYPLKIDRNSNEDDLDDGIKIELGDLGELIPTELDLIASANGFITKPVLKYRTFRSDDLSAPMFGPIQLEIVEFSFNKTGVKFEARSPRLNIHSTGELYTIERFPMLKGFL